MSKEFSIFKDYKSLLLIINPVSGRKIIIKYITDILGIFQKAGYSTNIMLTQKRGDAAEFASNYAKDYDLVVCTGGDGTLNETITGLAQSGIDIPLGYIPCGSTNDFAATHNISLDIIEASKDIISGRSNRYDIGCFNDQYFSYVAAFGAFSWLSYTTDQNLKNILGKTAYMLDAIKDLNKIKPIHMKIRVNEQTIEDNFIFGAVCNSLSIAGVLQLPQRIVDTADGILEVLLIRMPNSLMDLDEIVNNLIMREYSSSFIKLIRTSALVIENEPGLQWSLDGEKARYNDTINIKVVPGFLNLRS